MVLYCGNVYSFITLLLIKGFTNEKQYKREYASVLVDKTALIDTSVGFIFNWHILVHIYEVNCYNLIQIYDV